MTLVSILAQHLNTTPDEVERLVALQAEAIYDDVGYLTFVDDLNGELLQQTAPQVRALYDTELPSIKDAYHLGDTVMSGYTLSNWVLGFMMYPDRMRDMLERHTQVPSELVADVLPELLALIDNAPEDLTEWSHALAVFSLPLLAAR